MTYNKNIKEYLGPKDSHTIIKGKVRVLNKFGDVVLEKDNLVTLRGRTFVLEKLFSNMKDDKLQSGVPSSTINYIDNPNRCPVLFTIGTGGSQATGNSSVSSPSPFLPKYSDMTLVNPVPFVNGNLGDSNHTYFNKGVGSSDYFGKSFKSVSWEYSAETNEVYKKLVLEISPSDARGYTISEFGLLLGEPIYNSKNELIDVKDVELCTRVTFTGIPLYDGDYFTVEYFLYG